MNALAGVQSVAERLVAATASLSSRDIPARVRQRCEDLLVDVGGLCVAARASDYVRALVASVDGGGPRSEEHTSELQSRQYLVCRLLLEKKKKINLHAISE